jgi:riboflavin kinase/FMN adenylyltransferase
LVEYLRPEEKFDGLDALIVQMDRDSAAARRILAERAA